MIIILTWFYRVPEGILWIWQPWPQWAGHRHGQVGLRSVQRRPTTQRLFSYFIYPSVDPLIHHLRTNDNTELLLHVQPWSSWWRRRGRREDWRSSPSRTNSWSETCSTCTTCWPRKELQSVRLETVPLLLLSQVSRSYCLNRSSAGKLFGLLEDYCCAQRAAGGSHVDLFEFIDNRLHHRSQLWRHVHDHICTEFALNSSRNVFITKMKKQQHYFLVFCKDDYYFKHIFSFIW